MVQRLPLRMFFLRDEDILHYWTTAVFQCKISFTRVNYCNTFFRMPCSLILSVAACGIDQRAALATKVVYALCMGRPGHSPKHMMTFSPPCVVEVRGMIGRCENQLLLTIWSSPVSGGEECRSHTHTFRALLMLLWTGKSVKMSPRDRVGAEWCVSCG